MGKGHNEVCAFFSLRGAPPVTRPNMRFAKGVGQRRAVVRLAQLTPQDLGSVLYLSAFSEKNGFRLGACSKQRAGFG